MHLLHQFLMYRIFGYSNLCYVLCKQEFSVFLTTMKDPCTYELSWTQEFDSGKSENGNSAMERQRR